MEFAVRRGSPVFMLSGQGSQAPGMGVDLLTVPEVAETFACATDAFGFDVAALAVEGTPEELQRTVHAQAVISALSVGIARALIARGVRPGAVLGFSLGQVGALAVSGMLGLEATFELAAHRAKLMERAAREHPGAMCALLGADEQTAQDLCATCAEGEVLVPANFNCAGQVVVSGTRAAVARAQEAWTARKKRSALLATQGGFHSPLMQEASDELASYLGGVRFSEPLVPLVCNVDAEPLTAEHAADHLARHLTHPVRFDASVAALADAGATDFVETGFGGVLVGFVKRIDKGLVRVLVQDRAGFEEAANRYVAGEADDEAARSAAVCASAKPDSTA